VVVEFELTTCGCPQGGIGSVRVYRGDVETRKEIVSNVRDILEVLRYVKGDKALVRIRKRIPDSEFFYLLREIIDMGLTIKVTENKWGIDCSYWEHKAG